MLKSFLKHFSNSHSCNKLVKGGLISESISLWLQSPKNLLNHCREHYSNKEKMLRTVIWHIFVEIGAKVKNFLRLSHL